MNARPSNAFRPWLCSRHRSFPHNKPWGEGVLRLRLEGKQGKAAWGRGAAMFYLGELKGCAFQVLLACCIYTTPQKQGGGAKCTSCNIE